MGDFGADVTASRVLPLSGWVLQTRRDGSWRALRPEHFNGNWDGQGEPPMEWVTWSDGPDVGIRHTGAVTPGDSPDETWWLAWGARRADGPRTAELSDGAEVVVTVVGNVWACEWIGRPSRLILHFDDSTSGVPVDRRPAYLPPAPFPFRSPPDDGAGWASNQA